MNKNIIKSLITISIITALFVSCSGVNSRPATEAENETFILKGSFSAPETNASRSATSSFELDGDFELVAYQGNETPITGTVNAAASTWSVTLNKTGEWNIVINYKSGNVLILTGSKKITLESLTGEVSPAECVINIGVADAENAKGSIKLEVQKQVSGIDSVTYVLTGPNLSAPLIKDLDFTNNKAEIQIDSVNEGIYELELYFEKSNGELLYYCKEQIPVYCGYTTDTWYGESPYFVTEDGKTSLVIKSDLLDSFTAPKVLQPDAKPMILYDFNYRKEGDYDFSEEFENHVPGMSIFESVTENQKLTDGMPLAKNRQVKDFVIDDVTQAIITLESNPSKTLSYKIVSYPSYAGFDYGKTILSKEQREIHAIYAYDGYVYVFDSQDELTKISPDGTINTYYLYDEDVENTSSVYSFAVHGDYLYSAITDSPTDEENKFVLKFEKYAFVENGVNNNSYYQRVKSEEFIFSNTDLPCDLSADDLYYNTPKINDLQIIPDSTDDQKINIYAIFSVEKSDYYDDVCVSYGGLLKVSTENNSTSTFTMQSFAKNGPKVLGWYNGSGHSDTETDTNNWFYGPRKFIAKKPDELVIVDEGAYLLASGNVKNRNRVVTVKLSDFAMSAIDVETSFSNYAMCSNSSSYSGRYGDEY